MVISEYDLMPEIPILENETAEIIIDYSKR
jgi:hypothetical protein